MAVGEANHVCQDFVSCVLWRRLIVVIELLCFVDVVGALVDSEATMIRYLSETMVPVAYAMLFVDHVIMNALLGSYVSFSQVCPRFQSLLIHTWCNRIVSKPEYQLGVVS